MLEAVTRRRQPDLASDSFAEIANGHRLIPSPNGRPDAPPDEQYVYGGEPIALDPAGILPVPNLDVSVGLMMSLGSKPST